MSRVRRWSGQGQEAGRAGLPLRNGHSKVYLGFRPPGDARVKGAGMEAAGLWSGVPR